ncbi:32448_t:CDS:2, partial [Racocetra persica]
CIMYNEESSPNINYNLSMERTVGFAQNQTNINLLNIYDSPFIDRSASFTQSHEDQTNNSLSTEWSLDLTRDSTNTKWSTGFTNNILFIEWNAVFTQNQANASSLNIYNNLTIESSTGISQKDQTNTTLPNIYGAGITQPCDEQINTLQQQFNVKSVKKNEHPVSLVSRYKRNPKCKKCNIRKIHYDENSNQCKDCYRASLRALSSNKLIDNFIESTQTFIQNSNFPQDLVKLMESCWHSDPEKRWHNNNSIDFNLKELIKKAERGEIKFPENKDTSFVSTKINDQAIYSSRSLNLLISKALTLQRMKLSNNIIT